MSMRYRDLFPATLALGVCWALPVAAQQSEQDLAKKLANPVAALISVPFQLNYDQDIGPADDGERWNLNIQPVVPISLNEDWNIISRTIVPLVAQSDIFPGAGSQSGLGDIQQSVLFSPVERTESGWIVGVGSVFLLPTATDDLLGTEKWGLGPTGVALKQQGAWTYGALANHVTSIGGSSKRVDINATFLQPFVSYTTPAAWTFSGNVESTYDWEGEQWTIPLNLVASKVTKVGGQLVSFGAGVRYWVDAPAAGPEGVGVRFVMTLLFPR